MTSTSESPTKGTNVVSPSLEKFFTHDAEGRAEAIGMADEMCQLTGEIFFVTGTSEVHVDKGIALSRHMVYPCMIHTAIPVQSADTVPSSSGDTHSHFCCTDQSGANPAHALPFITAVGGHVLIHAADTGAVLPSGWTGLCVEARDVNVFWYIGKDNGERSFTRIPAKTLSSRTLAGLYPIKGSMPKEVVELLYWKREGEISILASQATVTTSDLELLDRGARFSVAERLFARCSNDAKHALLHDEHPHVRSAAAISNDKANRTTP